MSTDDGRSATLSDQVVEEILGLMGKRRINKAEMARRLGRKEDWVGRRLNGHQSIGIEDLHRIAVVLGVDAADLVPRGSKLSGEAFADARIVAVAGQDRSSRSIVRTRRTPRRVHQPGRAVSQTRPLAPISRPTAVPAAR